MKLDENIFKIVARIEGDEVGTAFYITQNILMTAYHVVKNKQDKVKIISDVSGNDEIFGEIYEYDEALDVALIKVNKKANIVLIPIAIKTIEEGEEWRSYTCFDPFSKNNTFEKEMIKGKIYQNENFRNQIYDTHLGGEYLSNAHIYDGFAGSSGTPLIINQFIVGFIIKEERSERDTPLKAISFNKFKEFFVKNNIKYENKIKQNNNINQIIIKNNKYNNIPYNENFNFTGREEILNLLLNGFKETNIQILSGMSGVGKTQIAIKYAYKNINRYKYIFWIKSDNSTSIYNDYIAIGKDLSIINGNEKEQEAIKKIYKWLSNTSEWLLIFDNCQEVNEIYDYIRDSKNGHIIITSKNSNWNQIRQPIKIKVFKENESLEFLKKRANITNEEEYIRELAKKLGNLPLALSQAISYIEETGCSFEEYIRLYNEYKLKMFEKNYNECEYEYTIKSVWKVSLNKIENISPISIKLIKFLSIFFNEKIPNWIIKKNIKELKNILPIDVFQYNEAIAILKKYSLLDINERYCSIHCLVQKVIQNELQEKNEFDEYTNRTISFINNILPSDFEDYEKLISISDLIPHIDYVIKLLHNHPVNETYINLLYKFSLCLRCNAQYDKAIIKIKNAFKFAKQLYGEENIKTLKISNFLAGILKDYGNLNEALAIYFKMFKINKTITDDINNKTIADDINLAININNIGLILIEMGNYSKALEYYNQAIIYYDEARTYYDQSSEYIKPFVTMFTNLSTVYLRLKNYQEADLNIEKAIKMIIEEYGEKSTFYARALNNKANILLEQNQYSKAKILYENAIQIDKNIYADNHIEILNKKHNLALCMSYLDKKQQKEAKQQIQNLIEDNKKVFGEKSQTVANDFYVLGDIYYIQGIYELAINSYSEAIYRYINLKNKNQFKILTSIKILNTCFILNSSMVLNKQNNIDESLILILIEDLLNIDEIYLNAEKNAYIEYLLLLGMLFKSLNKYKDSIAQFKQCLKQLNNNYDYEYRCYNQLTYIYYNQEDFERSYIYAKKTLSSALKFYNQNSWEIALIYNQLSIILYKLNNIKAFNQYKNNCIDIIKNNNQISNYILEEIKNNFKLIDMYFFDRTQLNDMFFIKF